MHVEDWNLFSLNHLHRGAAKRWIVVAPDDRDRFEAHMRAYHGALWEGRCGDPSCSQFVRHLSLWTPVQTLERWGIRHTRIKQRPGQLVVTAPGAYHGGWNAGGNVAEAVNYGDGGSATRLGGYQPCRWGCDPSEGSWDLRRRRPRARPTDAPEPVVLRWPESKGDVRLLGETKDAGENGSEGGKDDNVEDDSVEDDNVEKDGDGEENDEGENDSVEKSNEEDGEDDENASAQDMDR